MLDAVFSVIIPLKTSVPGKSIAMSQNNDWHINAKPDLSWEGLAWPWGSSVAVLGSGSTSIQLSIFCFTAVTVGFQAGRYIYPPANAGDTRDEGSISGSGSSPGVGNGKPLQYSCLENSMGRGAWWATVHGAATCLRVKKPKHKAEAIV